MAKKEKVEHTTFDNVARKVGDVMREPGYDPKNPRGRYMRVTKVRGGRVSAAGMSGNVLYVTGHIIPDAEAFAWFAALPKTEAQIRADRAAAMQL